MRVYIDTDIVQTNKPGIQLEEAAAAALYRMIEAAAAGGVTGFLIASGFRSYEYQQQLYDRAQARTPEGERISVAPPGTSEHETGYAVDIVSIDHPQLTASFADTPQGRWLAQNADSFGFTLSYPEGNDRGVIYEPWHFLYTGER